MKDEQQDSSDEYTVESEVSVDEEAKPTLDDGPVSDVVLNSEDSEIVNLFNHSVQESENPESAISVKKQVKKVSFSRDITESEYVVDAASTLGRPGNEDARPNAWFIKEHQDLNPGREDIVNHSLKTGSSIVEGVKCRSHTRTHTHGPF